MFYDLILCLDDMQQNGRGKKSETTCVSIYSNRELWITVSGILLWWGTLHASLNIKKNSMCIYFITVM